MKWARSASFGRVQHFPGSLCNSLCLDRTLPATLKIDAGFILILNAVCRRFERNAEGGFFRVFQQNKWKKRLEALQGTGVAV